MFIRTLVITCAFALHGCSGGDQRIDQSPTDSNEEVSPSPVIGQEAQFSNARLIQIDPPEGAQASDQPIADLGLVIQTPGIPQAPLEQSVRQDGSIVIEFGDRFMRPLIANENCDGKIDQSHERKSLLAKGSCGAEKSHGESK